MSNPDITPAADESRRSFLTRSAGMAAAAAPAALLLAGNASTAQAANGRLRLPEAYPGSNARNFHQIMADENTHATTIRKLLGSQARPKATYQGLQARDIYQFAGLAFAFENTGAGAYLGAAPAIFDKGTLGKAASIALVEAYHSGFINTIVGQPLTPAGTSFIYPYSIAQVLQNAGPFVASLNGGPPLSFDTQNPSPQNDIAILNFALVLEELEQEFYNINVPVFFG